MRQKEKREKKNQTKKKKQFLLYNPATESLDI